jgi:hypothetical protein
MKLSTRRRALGAAILSAVAIFVVAQAAAHVERASYWPDPAGDTHVNPPAGGKVPTTRSLYSALNKKSRKRTKVVCQSDSLARLKKSIAAARKHGYKYRPTEQPRELTKKRAKKLLAFNKRLFKACKFHEIQPAVMAARNNGRVVVMPGLYTEPTARKQPTDDQSCAKYQQENDRDQTNALSYASQYHCPNDQNLIAVLGRKPGKGEEPDQPRPDRHGIPNLGPCIRCNVQLEGSGVGADDVTVDNGDVKAGDKGPSGVGSKKDVGLRIDRADGFVMRNMKFRHAAEHNIYILETDGYRIEYFKSYYAGEYAVLTFVEDHGLMQHCDAEGNGDSGLYPGAAAETGEQTSESKPRYNQEIRYCDSHHNAGGYSGTDGNAVWVHHNNFYDNALGFTTDVFTASGHPGFPTDSGLIENNNFYSNNFNPYVEGSDVDPSIPVPVGTGLWIAGGNNFTIRKNHFWDNWRRGTMIFAVPDGTVCTPPDDNNLHGCSPEKQSTSYRNKTYGNVMGIDPSGKVDPNGDDFWWDEYAGNTNNCWHDNKGTDGTEKSIKSTPSSLPADCDSSMGTGGPPQEAELGRCLGAVEFDTPTCDWFTTPEEPQP